MGLNLNREKPRNWLVSLLYRLDKLLPLSPRTKLRLYLDLEWVFYHFAHDYTRKASLQIQQGESHPDFLVTKVPSGASILDIGCGRGFVAQRLLTKTTNILGIDYDSESIKTARANLPGSGARFEVLDVFDYISNNPDAAFDVIILSHVLEHIDEPKAFLERILRYGRYFYIEVPDLDATHLNIYRQAIGTDLLYADADHVSEFDRSDIRKIADEVGLTILDSEFRWGLMHFWCEWKEDERTPC